MGVKEVINNAEGFDCLLVDGPNFWNLLKACGGIPYLFTEFIPQVEEKLGWVVQRPVRFEEKIWVSPSLKPSSPQHPKIEKTFLSIAKVWLANSPCITEFFG